MKASSCHHCGLPIPEGVDIHIDAEGKKLLFCCRGCEGAYQIISGAGLEEFYQRREWQDPGLPEGAFSSKYDNTSLAPYVENHGDVDHLTFLIEGLRCATCVWLNERILNDLPGVIEARLNYGTHRARVIFDPRQTTPSQLFDAISRLGYNPRPFTRNSLAESRKREWHSLLIRFGTAFFLSMQLMGYSLALYAGFFQGIDETTRQIIQYFAAAVTTPVVFYAGYPFLHGAWRSLRNRSPDMDLLIALGVLAAYGTSIHALFYGGEVYFDTAAMIITFLLAGRLFESSAKSRAASGIDQLLQLAPETAHKMTPDGTIIVPSETLVPDDLIVVLPGQRFPVDGTVSSGSSDVDMSAATGEPLPVTLNAGDNALSGTLNISFPLQVKVTATTADSFMTRVAHLVEEAQARKAPVQRLADKIAALFVPLVLLLAATTGAYWAFSENASHSPLLTAVAVLVVACPCALGLATPTAIMVASGRAASLGILFRGGDTLEAAGRCNVVAFDKTGTLTTGQPRVTAIETEEISENQLLQFLATLEQGSTHPLAKGILDEARSRKLKLGPLPQVKTLPGFGLITGDGANRILAGNARLLKDNGIHIPEHQLAAGTPVFMAKGEQWLGTVFLEDLAREEAKETVSALSSLGISATLLTGDIAERAKILIASCGMHEFHAGLTPEEKAQEINNMRKQGATVLMAGDGINDAPALAAANVGCSMSGSTDIALESSDLVLTHANLLQLVTAIKLSRFTLRIIRQNLFWAFLYNLIALPLAASGLLYPIHAAAAMALSSICVVANSLRLKRLKLSAE